MRHFLLSTMVSCGLVLLPLAAAVAQDQPRQDRYAQVQDERQAMSHDRVFDRVRTDLDRADGMAIPFSGARDRVAMARRQVDECQHMLADGHYDREMFNATVSSVQRVADIDRLSDRTRTYLTDDIHQLRDLQSRLEQ
jgi:hypothetical protein